MTWLGSFFARLGDHLGGAPMALLEAINGLARDSNDQTQLIANKAIVVARLTEREGKALTPDAQRARIKMINDAAKLVGAEAFGGKAPFSIKSRKNEFIVVRPEDWRSSDAGATLAKSSRIDAASAPREYEEPSILAVKPRHIKPHHIIFVSHAHEDAEVEHIVENFAEALQTKFRALPFRYKDKFSLELWIDHQQMRDPHSYDTQAHVACKDASLAIFLLNNRWYESEACKKEAAHFGYPNPEPRRRFYAVQLSGTFHDGDPKLKSAPCYPMQWDQAYPNLITLWGERVGVRDQFLTELCNRICEQIDAGVPPPCSPSKETTTPKSHKRAERSKAVATRIERSLALTRYERVIADGQIENPALTLQEGGETSEDAIDALMQWACDPKSRNRVFALLGSFGSGKTTTSQLLVREMLHRRADIPRVPTPLPVYLDLRRIAEFYERSDAPRPSLAELVRLSLHEEVRDNVDASQLLALLRKEPCLVLFDGLDEVGTRIGPERLATLYRSMLDLIPPQAWNWDRVDGTANWIVCPTRLMVTCRTHFFRDNLEQISTLSSNDRHAGLAPKQGYRPVETRYMAPFRPEQIHSYFIKILGIDQGEAAWRSIERIEDLGELAQKPIMARYMAELADELVADVAKGREINAARLYDLLFRKAMLRDADKRPMLSVRDREKLLEELAEQLWLRRRPQLRANDLEDWFDDYIAATPSLANMARDKPDARNLLMTELRNASMLVRAGDDVFGFVHSSFQEYFLARRLLDDLHKGRLAARTEIPTISEETIAFLLDLIAIDDDWRTISMRQAQLFKAGTGATIRMFAFRLGIAMRMREQPFNLPDGTDLSNLDLRDLKLNAMSLRHVDLRETNLLAAEFTDIVFEHCDFSGTNIALSRFERCRFTDCQGTTQGAAAARLRDCHLDTSSNEGPFAATTFRSAATHSNSWVCSPSISIGVPVTPTAINCASFSPDGQRVVTASDDGCARIWDGASGAELLCLGGHQDYVLSAQFSPDGRRVLTTSFDQCAQLWDAVSGNALLQFEGHQDRVFSGQFSPDGQRIVTASDDNSARIWDVTSGTELIRLKGHQATVRSAQFSPDGQRVVTAGDDGSARVWDVANGAEPVELKGHRAAIRSAQFSPDGRQVVTAGDDDSARIWDAASGDELLRLEGHLGGLFSAQFSPDGQRIVTAGDDNSARIWAAASGGELVCLEGHLATVRSAQFSPDGQRVVTASDDDSARIWDAVTGSELLRLGGNQDTVLSAQFSPDSRRILVASENNGVRIWETGSGDELLCLKGHQDFVWSAQFSADGQHVVTASSDNGARLWDVAGGAELSRFEGHQAVVWSAQFSAGGRRVVTAGEDNSVRIWDTASGVELLRLEAHHARVSSAQFSPDEQHVVTVGDDESASIWDALTGKELRRLEGHRAMVLSAQFSPDGRRIVTASRDNSARVWDSASGDELLLLQGHLAHVLSAQFSPDGLRIVTASADNSARIWDAASGAEVLRLEHKATVRIAQFSSDGLRLLTVSDDNNTQIWNAASGRPLEQRYQFRDSWFWHEEQSDRVSFGPNAWKYLHAIDVVADGSRRIVNLWDHLDAA